MRVEEQRGKRKGRCRVVLSMTKPDRGKCLSRDMNKR